MSSRKPLHAQVARAEQGSRAVPHILLQAGKIVKMLRVIAGKCMAQHILPPGRKASGVSQEPPPSHPVRRADVSLPRSMLAQPGAENGLQLNVAATAGLAVLRAQGMTDSSQSISDHCKRSNSAGRTPAQSMSPTGGIQQRWRPARARLNRCFSSCHAKGTISCSCRRGVAIHSTGLTATHSCRQQ